jgi:hypothetical protein
MLKVLFDKLGLTHLIGKPMKKRAFIIGNGPSLRVEDLNTLHKNGEVCFGSNRIYKVFKETEWRPSYYVIEDTPTAVASANEIVKEVPCKIFSADYLKTYLGEQPNITYFNLLPTVQAPLKPEFSFDLQKGINGGFSVTYSMMQIAHALGFNELILLGVDFNYKLPNITQSEVYKGYMTYDNSQVSNYFIKDYVKPDEVVLAPNMEGAFQSYCSAKEIAEQTKKFELYNATRGGELELFTRLDFDALFN